MNKLKIAIAGPGAGKTYNLKNEVINSLSNLDRNRFCAVITYTNAATDELRKRIASDIPIPPNVFIGTIHSFLIRFIIEPFGHLVSEVEIPLEKNYIDNVKSNDPKKRNCIQKNLSIKGMITFDKVLQLSKEMIKKHSIRRILTNRIQFLFIDEYQDSKKNTHEFFLKIIEHLQESYFIGDKLQYIYEFTNRTKKNKNFKDTSFVALTNKFPDNIEIINDNFRSSEAIVNLINKYILRDEFKQHSMRADNGIPVYFINKTNASEIYSEYKQLNNHHAIDDMHKVNLKNAKKPFLKDFILTKDWIDKENRKKPKFKDVYKAINGEVARLEKGDHRVSGILQEVSRCILAVTGVKKHNFIKSIHDQLEYRKFCFEIVRCLKSKDFNNYGAYIDYIRKRFKEKFKIIGILGKQVDIEKSLIELSNKNSICLSDFPESCYSSIHSAKGLEATSVLAIAYSENELEKWLNFQEANNNLDDDFRLGYVAFSRARDMLCIACLGNVSNEINNKLKSLNIVFHPPD